MQPLTALRPQYAAKAAAILEHLSEALEETGPLWSAKPNLHVAEIGFKRRKNKNKAPIPVVNVYFVLSGIYSHDYDYQAVPVEDHPGHYEFRHKQIQYRISSTNYRKTVNKRLVPLLRSLAETENHQSKMAIKQNPISGILEVKYRTPDCGPLAFRFIPALAGTKLPEGINPQLNSLENQPNWFLVAPHEPTPNGTWQLSFPTVAEEILGSSGVASILLASWLAESSDWASNGVQNLSNAITAAALELKQNPEQYAHAQASVRHGAANLLQHLATKACQDESPLKDFFVPSREYLRVNDEQRELVVKEGANVIKTVTSSETWPSLVEEYPGLLPEDESIGNDFPDQGEILHEELSEITSTSESNGGESAGGDTESETPPTTRRPSAVPRRRSELKTQTASTSESDNEEPSIQSTNHNTSLSANGIGRGLNLANGKSSPAPLPRTVTNNRRVVKIVGVTMLLGIIMAVVAVLIVVFMGEYDWMNEFTRLYDAIIDQYENITGSLNENCFAYLK